DELAEIELPSAQPLHHLYQLNEDPVLVERGDVSLTGTVNVFTAIPGQKRCRLKLEVGPVDVSVAGSFLEHLATRRKEGKVAHFTEQAGGKDRLKLLTDGLHLSKSPLNRGGSRLTQQCARHLMGEVLPVQEHELD